jgi:hypothetical protein
MDSLREILQKYLVGDDAPVYETYKSELSEICETLDIGFDRLRRFLEGEESTLSPQKKASLVNF